MRGDGAVETLLDEDIVAFVLGDGLGCGESRRRRMVSLGSGLFWVEEVLEGELTVFADCSCRL